MNVEKIALFGLGKLGLPLSLVFAKETNVIGIDTDKEKIKKLQSGLSPFYEPNMDEYLISYFKNISFKTPYNYSISDFDIAIVLVNTPSNISGEFSNDFIYDVLDNISNNLKNSNKKDFLIILSSTVMPGSHDNLIKRVEDVSGKKINVDFGFVYAPDLVAIGTIINDFENPDLQILGESNKKYGDIAENLYRKIIKNDSPIVRMSLIESEITKVSLNAYVTMKISFANFIGNVSEKFNCNPKNITKALGYDKRISPFYLSSGLSFGGTCFPRDTWAFIKMSENVGLDAIHIKSTQKINENQNLLLYDKIKQYKGKRIGVYGLSFKPNTYVTTESPGNILYERLLSEKYDVIFYDKLITSNYSNKLESFINDSDVIVITHNTKDFKEVDLKNKIVINPWMVDIKNKNKK